MSARQQLGAAGEALAAGWYTDRGYEVIDRNWRVREGEIDLVARKGRLLVFCEVKTRTSDRFGSPAEAVTFAKQRRIRRAAAVYLQRGGLAARLGGSAAVLRFDVACVTGAVVEVIESAF